MQKGGVDNLKSMPFFSGLDFMKLAKLECEPPLLPQVPSMEKFLEKQLSVEIDFNPQKINAWDDA